MSAGTTATNKSILRPAGVLGILRHRQNCRSAPRPSSTRADARAGIRARGALPPGRKIPCKRPRRRPRGPSTRAATSYSDSSPHDGQALKCSDSLSPPGPDLIDLRPSSSIATHSEGIRWPSFAKMISSRASPTPCNTSPTITPRISSGRWAVPMRWSKARRRATRLRRYSPTRGCAPRAIARSARTRGSWWCSSRWEWAFASRPSRDLEAMINEGVRRAYLNPDNKLRASIVADPAGKRTGTKDNTPAVIHTEFGPGDKLEITVAAKGGGSENKSMFAMLNPSDSVADWVVERVPEMGAGWCPPGHARRRHRRQRGESHAAREEIPHGSDRHRRSHRSRAGQQARGAAPGNLQAGQRAWGSARRGWAASPRCST